MQIRKSERLGSTGNGRKRCVLPTGNVLIKVYIFVMRIHHHRKVTLVFADDLAMHLLPKVAGAWMRQGTQAEILTPGKNGKHPLAGALQLETGNQLYNALEITAAVEPIAAEAQAKIAA
jgi:hypothetical protein